MGEDDSTEPADDDLPADVIDEAERLTRLARDAVDESEAEAYREARGDLLDGTGFAARVREDDRDTLVLYPTEWVVEGTVDPARIDDVDRGVERPLEGPGDEWAVVEEHNRAVAATVADRHGDVHGRNAHALADFAGNHYAKPIERLTREERAEFRTEYFPRNAFASGEQKQIVAESVELAVEIATEREAGGTSGDSAGRADER